MPYYPLSQIKTNLYTNGYEFTTDLNNTTNSYVGYYWKTSTNQFFTGKTPQDEPNTPLFEIPDLENYPNEKVVNTPNIISLQTVSEDNFSISNYLKLTSTPVDRITYTPYYNPQQPTQQDYQNGEFRRFFCKKANEILYIEINKDQYDKLIVKDPQILWQLYLPFDITWRLTGDKQQVARVNKNMVELAIKNLKLPKFNLYIKEDYTKYYQ
jgi:hypothetical protein